MHSAFVAFFLLNVLDASTHIISNLNSPNIFIVAKSEAFKFMYSILRLDFERREEHCDL